MSVYLVNFKGSQTVLQICRTCHILRTLRVFHCKDCDLCVDRHGNTI